MAEETQLTPEEIRVHLVSLQESEGWKIIKRILDDNVDILKDIIEDKVDHNHKDKIKTIEDWKVMTSRLNDRQKLLLLPKKLIENIDQNKGIDAKDFDCYD